jgi:hypothetical protein
MHYRMLTPIVPTAVTWITWEYAPHLVQWDKSRVFLEGGGPPPLGPPVEPGVAGATPTSFDIAPYLETAAPTGTALRKTVSSSLGRPAAPPSRRLTSAITSSTVIRCMQTLFLHGEKR